MKVLQNIWVFIAAMLFLFSATGIVVIHAHCSCTGTDQVSVYVSPETCEDIFHEHHDHVRSGEEIFVLIAECHECRTHTEDCGCNTPEVRFFKLNEQMIQEKVRMAHVMPVHVALFPLLVVPQSDADLFQANIPAFADPPLLIRSSLDYLIHIQKLKIPLA